jgi:hypothetical protein
MGDLIEPRTAAVRTGPASICLVPLAPAASLML